jgi:hypothetical protein
MIWSPNPVENIRILGWYFLAGIFLPSCRIVLEEGSSLCENKKAFGQYGFLEFLSLTVLR